MSNTIIDATNQIADKSDRWLFLAAILFLVVGGVLAIRYLVAQYQDALKQNQERNDAHTTSMERFAERQMTANEKLAVVLDRNTTALNDNTTELRLCRESRHNY